MLSRFELRRFRGLLPVLALLFAMIVPVIYGFVYLSANWDPYGRLENLPVALVNEDVPTTYDGKEIHAGQDVADELLSQKSFQWHQVDADEAERGLQDGTYYLTLHIPSDFSTKLISASTHTPERAGMTLRRNDANGFVIGSVTGQAQNKVELSVEHAVVDAYFKAVFANLGDLRTGVQQAQTGAAQLTSGLESAKSGSAQLTSGINEASSATGKLADGADTLNRGMPALTSGATSLQSGLDQLSTASSQLATGAGQVATGTQQLSDKVVPVLDTAIANEGKISQASTQINTTVQQVNTQVNSPQSVNADLDKLSADLDALAQANPSITSSQAYSDARARLTAAQTQAGTVKSTVNSLAQQSSSANGQIQALTTGGKLEQAKSDVTALNAGAHQVATGAQQLHSGIDKADQGSAQLTTGITQVAGGVSQLDSGLGELRTGMGKLATGSTQLDNGLGQLVDGSTKLRDGLSTMLDKIPAISSDQADQAALVVSQPVDVRAEVINPANVYGRGLAPLFFSIAMWVFGISGFLVMRPISGRLLAGRLNPIRLTMSAWLPFGAVGVVGALLMLTITWGVMGLDPVHPLALVALTVLTAVAFSGIAHVMRMGLGLPGSALLLVWLILQLSSTGGTYPSPLLPPVFQLMHPVMPITYTIDAYRVAISGGLWSHYALDMAVLAVIAATAFVVDVFVVRRRQRFTMADLHPPLQH